jgi:hypothetical protein
MITDDALALIALIAGAGITLLPYPSPRALSQRDCQ